MIAPEGRSIFVVELAALLRALGVRGMVERARHCHFSSVWIRIGRGQTADPNLNIPALAELNQALRGAGIGLWGWHVPFCPTREKATAEAQAVLGWATTHALSGVVSDAERTEESPRFRGGPAEAEIYSRTLADGLTRDARGIAFSSHDQPPLHQDLPFAAFLGAIPTACPQIYDRSSDPERRFRRSEAGYRPLLGARFNERYHPTGNICTVGDVRFPDVQTCLAAVGRFLDLVEEAGYPGHSFWCWEEAPEEIWDLLNGRAPPASGP
jgi:hypothetical protein